MDPLSIVLQALQLGASLISQGATSEIGKDLYVKLKDAISHRSFSNSGLVAAINGYENKPNVYGNVLEAELIDSKLFNEQEILAIANEILQRNPSVDYRNNSGNINNVSGAQHNQNISGGTQYFGNIGSQTNFSGDQVNQYGIIQPTITAIGLIKKISSRHKSLENLPPSEANNLWDKLEEIADDAQLTKAFCSEPQSAQLVNVFQLLVAYCCYFSNRSPVPQREFNYSSQNDYYRAIEQSIAGLRFSVGIDSIVRDKNLAHFLRSVRQPNF